MRRFRISGRTLSAVILLIALALESAAAQLPVPSQESTPQTERQERRQRRRDRRPADGQGVDPERARAADPENTIEVIADSQEKDGDNVVYEGYVIATLGELRLQADRVTLNIVTSDMIADGNVIFDEGADQRVTARRAEINWSSGRGVFWDTTGFTNRTQTGEYIYYTAERVEKTGDNTYQLFNASLTACEDAVPKWSFEARRAELNVGDRVKLHNSVFRVKGFPAFVLPYAWIPATRSERKSGFLIPTTGSSNQKGRTLKYAYYQTLGPSADVTLRNDIYTARGLGFGAEFRAQTDQDSFLRLGVYSVKDRLFGEPGEDQGGTAFIGEAVQYLPGGWLAVGSASLVSSLQFRQVFSDDISQVIDPRRESTLYVNNNSGAFSFNFVASKETTRLFTPGPEPDVDPAGGTDSDISIRQAPEIETSVYPRRLFSKLPIYFSFESSVGALKREESVSDTTVVVTPSAVQRFDFTTSVTVPVATFWGTAITPSLDLRETYYTSRFDPLVPAFDPARFTLNPGDARLDAGNIGFDPELRFFDRLQFDPIRNEGIARHYAQLEVDIRPPSLERTFRYSDGSSRFKHLIEPYVTYRLIGGIGDEFDRIIRFDERDAVANTNEVEYAIVNRFFVTRTSARAGRRRRRPAPDSDQMEPVRPERSRRRGQAAETTPQTEEPDAPKRLERGEKEDLSQRTDADRPRRERATGDAERAGEAVDEQPPEPDEAVGQPYEILSIKVAQKYFFDREFGGALEEGRRNQFYPINALSGFTFGGRARSFSPANVQVRYRPLSSVFADMRMDVDGDDGIRNVKLSGGLNTEQLRLSTSWYLTRRLSIDADSFEPGTFPGNQIVTTVQYGDETRGLYGGARIGYDFTDRLTGPGEVSTGRLRNSRSYFGYGWDCCGIQFNYNTFKAGLRSESAFSFTFTLAGLGSFGTEQFSQAGGGRGGRRRGRRQLRGDEDFN